MDYSLTKRRMNVGVHKGKDLYVANPVCQKQRISFDKLCQMMSDGSTVSEEDVAAVFYKFRKVLNQLCSQGSIVDAGPLGVFRPSFTSKAVESEDEFRSSTHITKTQILFTPTPEFRQLRDVEYFRVAAQSRKRSSSAAGTSSGSSSGSGSSGVGGEDEGRSGI